MKEPDYIFCFLKFGNELDLLDLLDNGTIFMNPIDKFRTIEDNFLRGDNYEGVSKIWNFPAGQLEIPHINYKGNYEHIHLRESYANILGNIYCLFCVSSDGFENPSDFYVDDRVKEFGSHFVAVRDINEFIRRVRTKLKDAGYRSKCGFVDYYDKNNINGEISVFQKPQEFRYQREFRFYVYQKIIAPLSIKIGSIRDIAEMASSRLIDDIQMLPTNYQLT